MKCLILAAGYATRLYPLTENFPKPLLSVAGKTILDRLLEGLGDTEIDEFVVISNHKFVDHFSAWAKSHRKVTVVDDGTCTNEERLGAVRDLEFTVKTLGIDEDILVVAGDNVLDFPLSTFVKFAVSKGTSCVMCHEENDLKRKQKTAIITVDNANRITSYEEKPSVPRGNLAVPPFYYYTAADIGCISEALETGCNPDAPGSFAAWLRGRVPIHAFFMPGRRYDIGDMESYKSVSCLFQSGVVTISGFTPKVTRSQ